jgi:acyl-CoA synthetase (AMP-forming)/AMP-acid ligase II
MSSMVFTISLYACYDAAAVYTPVQPSTIHKLLSYKRRIHAHTLQQEGLKQGTTRPLFRSDKPTEGLMTSEYKAAYVAAFSPQKNSPFIQNVTGTGDSRPWQVRNCQVCNCQVYDCKLYKCRVCNARSAFL